MNREKIITEFEKVAEKDHSWYSIKDCSVVGKTEANLVDYNYQKVEISPSDDVLFITLISSGWAVRTSIMEEYADLQVHAENGVLTIKGKRCELVVEKEEWDE